MSHKNNLDTIVNPVTLTKHLLIGGAIALLLIGIFLAGTGEPNPEWGKLWMIRPLIIVPLAGAAGGLFYHLATVRFPKGWKNVLAIVSSAIVYIFGLWIGTILGLDGTYWN